MSTPTNSCICPLLINDPKNPIYRKDCPVHQQILFDKKLYEYMTVNKIQTITFLTH